MLEVMILTLVVVFCLLTLIAMMLLLLDKKRKFLHFFVAIVLTGFVLWAVLEYRQTELEMNQTLALFSRHPVSPRP